MALKRTGDWNRVRNVISHIGAEMLAAQRLSLQRFALKAEGTAKLHISSQDLGWRPLKARTIAEKAKKGYSSKILVASSTYFQSITSWVDGNTALAGVKRGVRESNQTEVGDLARMLEFGSSVKKIPARPLWQPTFEETVKWTIAENNPAKIAVERLRRY